ncbi:hypothetical protein [Synechococcus sp. CBW1107]|uniref:hypothetical protein n=1 Tax=Synechococcus sp. CBW1107 TaxID=2789857 RepID=UPI002AD2CFEF|nr:hypothetical protein [Synechococcus sp. CBW1107]
MDAFLRWSHPDLLEPRLLQCCWMWQVLHVLDLDPAGHAAPDRGHVSEVCLPGLAQPLLLSSARFDQDEPTTFRIAEFRSEAMLFGLLQAGEQGEDPLDPVQWSFWLVPSPQLHPDRRSIGLQALLRARGEGLALEQLPAAIAPWATTVSA